MSLDVMKQVLAVMDVVAPSSEASAPRYYAARKALRAAIEKAQPELETYKRLYELRGKALERPCSNCGHQPAKIKKMAQPEQHEQTLMDALIGGTGVMLGDKRIDPASIYKEPDQEPVAWVYPEGLEALKSGRPWTAYGSNGDGRIPLYLNDAVARKWQGLTDDEREQFRQWAHPDIIEAIELKLQERNT